MSRRSTAAALGVAALALGAPVAGLAAKTTAHSPKKNAHYELNKSKKGDQGGFDTAKDAKSLINLQIYTKCSPLPWLKHPTIPVTHGKVDYKGTIEDVTHSKVHVRLELTFSKATKAVGSMQATSAKCKDKAHSVTAVYSGAAEGANGF
jgi:hypothetical protein